MNNEQPIIVDTNILFSALLRTESHFAVTLLHSERTFYICEFVLVELFKYKERIVQASRLSEDDVLRMYHVFLRRINLYKEDLISPDNRSMAYNLCHDIDPKDSLQVALTLEINGLLWTGDKKLRTGLTRKGFTHFYDLHTV